MQAIHQMMMMMTINGHRNIAEIKSLEFLEEEVEEKELKGAVMVIGNSAMKPIVDMNNVKKKITEKDVVAEAGVEVVIMKILIDVGGKTIHLQTKIATRMGTMTKNRKMLTFTKDLQIRTNDIWMMIRKMKFKMMATLTLLKWNSVSYAQSSLPITQ